MLVYWAFSWRPAYWVDEYLTQAAVARSWSGLLGWITTTDPGPGPYYLAMKAWSYASDSPGWMRLPSVLASAAAVVVLAALVRRLTDTTTASLAAVVMIILPNVSRYAQENRPYALALLGTVVTVALWHRSQPEARSRWWGVGYGAAVVGMGLAHLYTLTLLPALAVAAVLWGGGRRQRLARTLLPAGLAVLALVPHIGLNLAHPTGSPTDPPLSVASLLEVIRLMMPEAMAGAVVIVMLVGVVGGRGEARDRSAVVLGLLWLLVPTALLLAAKLTLDLPVTRVRYLLFVTPAVALLVAVGLRRLARTSLVLAVIVVTVLAGLGVPRQVDIRQLDGHNRDQALAPLLGDLTRLGVPIVVANRSATRLVNAATYPESLLTDTVDPAATPAVAVVERTRFAHAVPDELPYYQASGLWRQIIKCRIAQALVLVFENKHLPQQSLGPPVHLAARLTAATEGRATCRVVTGLDRR